MKEHSTRDDGIEDARDVAVYEFGSRTLDGLSGRFIAVVAAGWSCFQLALPQLVLLDSITVRCVHLAFALALVYLSFPGLRGRRLFSRRIKERVGDRSFLFDTRRIHFADYALACAAVCAALYLAVDYEGIGSRIGLPTARDLAVGIVLIVLLLEAARRALGFALPTIAGLFILYSFVSESMPGIIAFKNASLNKVITKLTLTTEGIYGVPLDVSASVVFLFVLFGAMLEKAGGGQYFIDLAFSLLGRYRGGPAKACVLASGMTGMVNGSSIANTVTTGTFTIPLMKKAGFPAVKAGAIEVAASTNGQLMPPIMGAAAFIIAEYCNMTYFEVVRAAFIPAVISYIALIYITHLEASKLGLQGLPREELPRFRQVVWRGAHFVLPLLLLLYQLVIERRSAQLSAYYSILLLAVLMVGRHAVRAITGRSTPFEALRNSLEELWLSLVAGGRNMMTIGVAVAGAGIIVGIVTLGLGSVMTDLIDVVSMGNLTLMLLVTAVISLILGMGLPTTANYIVMASLTAPAIMLLAHDAGLAVPLIAAHLFCFYFGILSDDTPPVGLSAYAAAAISRADPIATGIRGFGYDSRTALLPFMFIFNTDLLLIGVTQWWHILLVFLTGVVAMFCFAALIANYMVVRNRWHESLLLLSSTIILLRPDFFVANLSINKYGCYAAGALLFALVHGMQKARQRKSTEHRERRAGNQI